MFVAWQRKALSENGSRRHSWDHDVGDACACNSSGPGREKLTPVVRRAFRANGKPRNEVVCRPACGIRRCCLDNVADPIARVEFWRAFRRKRDEVARVVPDEPSPVVELYFRRESWLRAELARVVPIPTDDDEALYNLFVWPDDTFDPATMVEDRKRRLAEARERLEAYKRGRRRGEAPGAWWERARAETEAERARRWAEEQAELRRRWTAWVYSPPSTPPPSSPVPPVWQQLRDSWLRVEAASRSPGASGWGREGGRSRTPPTGEADFMTTAAGRKPTEAQIAAAAAELGLRWPCGVDQAKAAYRRLATEHHPDRCAVAAAKAAATARLTRINVAFEVVQRACQRGSISAGSQG